MSPRVIPIAAVVAGAALLGALPAVAQDEVASSSSPAGASAAGAATRATTLLDLSGLAPLGPGLALGVHDGKDPDEDDRPRASVLTLSTSPSGVTWRPVAFEWSDDVLEPDDLESASGVPGTPMVVFAESGDDGTGFQRLFLAEIDVDAEGGPVGTITAVADWPEPVFNVEGMAVAQVGDDYVLLYAERAQGDPTTVIQLAPMTLDPFGLGEPTGVDFTSPAVRSDNDRPVSAMEVASGGVIHVASAFDSGSDDGPYSGSVWAIGAVVEGDDGPVVELMPEPAIVAFTDGYKTESLAVLTTTDGEQALYIGTDDEDYGGTLRPLPTQ